jgi:hypothetical protein
MLIHGRRPSRLWCIVAMITASFTVAIAARPSELRAAETTDYSIRIKTADQSGAGTDSNIFLALHGESGRTAEVRLNPLISHNAFERNSTETVLLRNQSDVGRIYQVDIRSDDKYLGSDWRLDWIKIDPSDPHCAATIFYYNDWVGDTKTRNLTAYEWPWPLEDVGTEPAPDIVQQVSLVNLLDASDSVRREYTVTSKIEDQVQISTEVTTADDLKSEVKWKAPDLAGLGNLEATVSATLSSKLIEKRVDTTTRSLTTQDTHTMTFPAGRITMVEVDWVEPWLHAVGTFGSLSMGVRWLQSAPVASWTIGTYTKGAVVPEPFATFLRRYYPNVAKLFSMPDVRRVVSVNATHNTLSKIAKWKLRSSSRWRDLYKWNRIYFAKQNVAQADAQRYRIEPGTRIYYGVKKATH